MYDDNLLAGRGLRLLFISQLLSLVAGLVGDGLLQVILYVVSLVMAIGALNVASPSHPYFGRAFWLTILQAVFNGLSYVTGHGLAIFTLVLALGSLVLNVYIVYLICTGAGQILTVNGYADLADKGATVWKINLCCTVALACFTVLALVPLLLILAGVLVIGTVIAMLVGSILYLKFLSNAYHILLGAENL